MSGSSPLDARLASFYSSLESLCRAAGPPAPSFSITDLDKAIDTIVDRTDLYPSVFSALDYRLSCDSVQTALSVRAMLWSLIVRMMERTQHATNTTLHAATNTTTPAAAIPSTVAPPKKGDEWSALLAPQLYRLVMSIVPRQEDATANVQLTKQQLLKWMNQAEQNAATAPFKRHQLVNALKYVEGYVYEPPPLTEEEKAEYKRRRKARKRREKELQEESRRRKKKRKREKERESSKANGDSPGSPIYSPSHSPSKSASDNNESSDDDAAMSRSDSPHSKSGSSGNDSDDSRYRSDSEERRHAKRLQISHTASEGAEASRLLELLRASQKRAQVEGALRPQGESKQSWEEMEEIRQHFRQKRELKRLEAASSASSGSASTGPSAGSVHSFLASWLSTRNHWKATRDCEHDEFDERFDGGRHELDEWIRYFESNQQPLPSAIISHGATRMWNKLNEQSQQNQNQLQQHTPTPLLPLPAPSRLYAGSSTDVSLHNP